MTAVELEALGAWIGRRQVNVDTVTPRLAAALHATLEFASASPLDAKSDPPGAIAWCVAPQIVTQSDLGPDGHPQRGGFLPPVPLPRRMWAASDLTFNDTLQVGDEVVRESRVIDVTSKVGSTGPLCFVTVQHELTTRRGPAISERQSIVYRQLFGGSPPKVDNVENRRGRWRREIRIDPVLMFRFSALTFNSHRIHYDRDYCREHEGYSDLVVQGPLQASYLLELAASIRGRPPAAFTFRAIEPALCNTQLTLHADRDDTGMQLWVSNEAGRTTLRATASW